MNRTISLVQTVQIASPCTAKWDDMAGDDRSRFCSHCTLNVYNLSAMTEAEGEALIIEKEGKLCARIYRRYDGTVLTKDCPVGLRAVRKRMMWLGMRAAAAVTVVAAAVAYSVSGRPRSGTQVPDFIDKEVLDLFYQPTAYSRTLDSMQRWLVSPPIQRGWLSGDMASPPLPVNLPTPPLPMATAGTPIR